MYKRCVVLVFCFLLITPSFSIHNTPPLWDIVNPFNLNTPRDTVSRQSALRLYSKDLTTNLTNAIVPNFVSLNNRIFNAAQSLPQQLSPNRRGLGLLVSVPVQLGTVLGNILAPFIVRYIVSRPINAVSSRISSIIDTFGPSSSASQVNRQPSGLMSALTRPGISSMVHMFRRIFNVTNSIQAAG